MVKPGCTEAGLRSDYSNCTIAVQVAEQQGKYLARQFNSLAKDRNAKIEPFVYKHLGSMASIGNTLQSLCKTATCLCLV